MCKSLWQGILSLSAIIVQTKFCSLTDQISAGKTYFLVKGLTPIMIKLPPFLLPFFFWRGGGVVGGTESSDIFSKKKFKLALVNFMVHNRFWFKFSNNFSSDVWMFLWLVIHLKTLYLWKRQQSMVYHLKQESLNLRSLLLN